MGAGARGDCKLEGRLGKLFRLRVFGECGREGPELVGELGRKEHSTLGMGRIVDFDETGYCST